MKGEQIIFLAISLAIAIIVSLISYYIITHRKKRSYNKDKGVAILEEVRSDLEKQIYALNDRLIQSEERWRDVNHLLLENEYTQKKSHLVSNSKITLTEFLESNGVAESDLVVDSKLIFILTPFNDEFYDDYQALRDICSRLGFSAFRGDEIFFQGNIFPQMLKYILKAKIVIANINGRNPNVMYELGIAHALNKPVLLISHDVKNLPADIKSNRFLIYSNYTDLEMLLRSELINIS